jgi:DNA-directed RNA polymerase specialized sigma24 family protein
VDAGARAELHALMVRLSDGDRAAFHPIYAALWPLLRRFVSRQLAPADAEDVAQQALLKVFARASELDPERDGVAWALGIAAWEVRTHRRRALRRREEPEAPAACDPSPDLEALALARELELAAVEVLGTLRPLDVETLSAMARGDRPSGPTFRKRLERALVRFREEWRSRHGAG